MKKLILLLSIFSLCNQIGQAQGCVAIRNLAGFGQFASLGYGQTTDRWSLDINNRYFTAQSLFVGKTDLKHEDSINLYEYYVNFQLSRVLSNGWSLSVDMPIASNTAVSSLEHAGGGRHSTHAFGIGDIRFTVYKWLLDAKTARKGNIQVGLGIKFPTGNYHSEDYFYDQPGKPNERDLAPVNVAIQLGDGGTGITTELNAFYIFNPTISVYGNFFYLISPKNTNGVASFPPNALPPPVADLFHTITIDVNSVPDNYTMRAGANFTINRFVATAGLRYEGAPAHDLFGQNDGLRRVGHIFSAEPGVQYKFRKSFLYSFVTLPIDRATIQTVPDKRQEAITGMPTTTGGHFANWIIFVGYTFTF